MPFISKQLKWFQILRKDNAFFVVLRLLWHCQFIGRIQMPPSLAIKPKHRAALKVRASLWATLPLRAPSTSWAALGESSPASSTVSWVQLPSPANVSNPPGKIPHLRAQLSTSSWGKSGEPIFLVFLALQFGEGEEGGGMAFSAWQGSQVWDMAAIMGYIWTNDWPFLCVHILLFFYKKGNYNTDHIIMLIIFN